MLVAEIGRFPAFAGACISPPQILADSTRGERRKANFASPRKYGQNTLIYEKDTPQEIGRNLWKKLC